jgi:hypothetical protein
MLPRPPESLEGGKEENQDCIQPIALVFSAPSPPRFRRPSFEARSEFQVRSERRIHQARALLEDHATYVP